MSQLTTQDLQYIDLVLAGDLMNPIWSFEMSVELKWSVVQSDGQTEWPALLAQDGGDEEKYGYLKLSAPGGIGERISGMFYIADGQGDPLADKGADYPPTVTYVSMLRASNDPSTPEYNIYFEERNRPVIITHKPTEELVNIPKNAIVLSDDIIASVARLCEPTIAVTRVPSEVCSDFGATAEDLVTFAGSPEGTPLVDAGVRDYARVTPIDDIRLVMTMVYSSENGQPARIVADADTFEIRWQPGSTDAPRADPPDLFGFQIVNSNPDIEYPTDAIVSWRGGITREFDDDCPANPIEEDHQLTISLGTGEDPGTVAGPYVWMELEGGEERSSAYDAPECGKRTASKPYELSVVANIAASEFAISPSFWAHSLGALSQDGALNIGLVVRQDIPSTIVQEYWDHYPYLQTHSLSTGANITDRWIECISAGAIAGSTKPPRCGQGNSRELPTVSDIVPAEYTSTYTKTGSAPCDDSCAEMLSANYKDADLTIAGTGFSFVETVNLTWNQYMQAWYAQNPVEEEYVSTATYTAWVQSIWRNPERQEYSKSVINSAHQFGVGVDFSHKTSFWDQFPGRVPYAVGDNSRASANICLLAWAAWDSGGTRQTLVENINKSPAEYYEWTATSTISSCITAVDSRSLACLGANPANASYDTRRLCTPTHVHSARPND